MALSAANQILAADFVALKARVKAEMERRCQEDSLAAYAGTEYDYSVEPTQGGQVLIEHINKIVGPINAISDTGIDSEQVAGAQLKALDDLDTALSAHELIPMKGSGTDCSGGCAGLCSSGCWDNCEGCTASCASSCSGGCSGGCKGCGGSCSSNCSGGCKGGCTGCSGGCSTTCSGTCSGGCSTTCTGGCKSGCKGCSGSCGSTCTTGCTN